MKINTKDKEHWLSLRAENINSTDCATLFGLSPYKTIFELWHEKKHQTIIQIEENERMKWGGRLESAIADGIAHDRGWKIDPMKDYYFIPELKLGSSFDYLITSEQAILEIKNVDSLVYRKSWTEFESPAHIELQVQHQMLVSGYNKSYICAFVGGNSFHVIEREAIPSIHNEIKTRAAAFWKSIEDNIEPKIDYERDADFLITLNQVVDPGTIYEGDTSEVESLVIDYKRWGQIEAEAAKEKKTIKAKILEIIGDKEKVKHEKFTISSGMIGEQKYEVVKKPYRDFRIILKGDE